jgi:hypothetical protein
MAIATKKTIGARGSGKITSSATVTLKQIAAQLAERQDLSKKQTEAILADLVALTARHLKKGLGCASPVSVSCKFVTGRRAWDATQPPARPSGSRPARRSPFAPPRS